MPRAPWRMRPTLSQCCACANPPPSSPMRSSTGTLTLSNGISHGRSSITSPCVRAGDEALGAVDDVVVALAHSGGAHAARVAARVRLGLRQAPFELAADGRQQVFLLLRLVEVIEDRADVRAEDLHPAAGQRNRAAELRPHGDLGDE